MNFFARRRDEIGLTQRQIAERFSPPITPQAVSGWENGLAGPELPAKDLARIYQCEVSEILVAVEQLREDCRAAKAAT